jgi:hypothetical protein
MEIAGDAGLIAEAVVLGAVTLSTGLFWYYQIKQSGQTVFTVVEPGSRDLAYYSRRIGLVHSAFLLVCYYTFFSSVTEGVAFSSRSWP